MSRRLLPVLAAGVASLQGAGIAVTFLVLLSLVPTSSADATPSVPAKCDVTINSPHIVNDWFFGPLITYTGAVNCTVAMVSVKVTSLASQEVTPGWFVAFDTRSYAYTGSVHKYFTWYAGPCVLAFAAPKFKHSALSSVVFPNGQVMSGLVEAPVAQLAGCAGLA